MSKKPQHVRHAKQADVKSSALMNKFKKPDKAKEPSAEKSFLKKFSADRAKEEKIDAENVKPEKTNAEKTADKPAEHWNIDNILLIRLVLGCVIFAVSLIIKLSDPVRVILLVLSAVVAGYDIFLSAADELQNGNYFATTIVVVFVAVLSFVIGFGIEGAALVLLYQIGVLLIRYTIDKTRKSAQELLRYQDEETVCKYSALIRDKSSGHMEIEDIMRESSGNILKYAMIFGVLYAFGLPLFTSFGFAVSIHRALMIILIATPVSVVVAMPLTGMVGLCYSAQQGVFFKNAEALEKAGECNIVVLDKAGVLSSEAPRVIAVQSEVVDKNTFMNFASHAVYYSDQPIARAISAINNQEYKLELISDFVDIPGQGVDVKIGGARVTLASSDLFASRGVYVPQDDNEQGKAFYMTVSDRYIGKIVIYSEINDDAVDLSTGISALNLDRTILLTDDGEEESQNLADELDIVEVISGCDTDKKLKLLSDLKQDRKNRVLYVYSEGFEGHSEADVDMRVSKKAKYADAQVKPNYTANVPFSVEVGRRTREVAVSNAVFAFVVKAILIFLSIIGYCNIWFAVFIDMVAALATILNAIRVTSESIIKDLKYKTGH